MRCGWFLGYFFFLLTDFLKRTKSRNEAQKDKHRWKTWSKHLKTDGGVSENVVGVAISPRSPWNKVFLIITQKSWISPQCIDLLQFWMNACACILCYKEGACAQHRNLGAKFVCQLLLLFFSFCSHDQDCKRSTSFHQLDLSVASGRRHCRTGGDTLSNQRTKELWRKAEREVRK